jgi:hypothetical protein
MARKIKELTNYLVNEWNELHPFEQVSNLKELLSKQDDAFECVYFEEIEELGDMLKLK